MRHPKSLLTTVRRRSLLGLSLALLSAATLCQASIVQFDLSPAGSDKGIGLSPSNQVPPAVDSSGSGNALAIMLDTTTRVLSFGIGYGSSAGYHDLTAPAVALHLHGPAPVGSNGPVVFDLANFSFPAPDATRGGVIYGAFEVPSDLVSNLLAGLNYINIHTTNYLGGEIRAQLIPRPETNHPPIIICQPGSTYECNGQPVTLTTQVTDPDGDRVVVIWKVNGASVQTNRVAASIQPTTANLTLSANFALGTNLVLVTAKDSAGNIEECETTVVVVDTKAPVITKITANPSVLWPPNHKMVAVRLTTKVADDCGETTWKILSITSSEAVDAIGSGNTAPDWEITGSHTANLRAERSGKTGPRFYTLTVQAKDSAGNVAETKTVTVTVPHDMSGKK